MNIILESKTKITIFTNILSNIQRFSDSINMNFNEDQLYVQGMDSAHVCIYEICLKSDWFETYSVTESLVIGVNSAVLCFIFGLRQEHQRICIEFIDKTDKLGILFKNNQSYPDETPREFYIPTLDIDQDMMEIPESEYEVSFVINSKKFADLISPLAKFGDSVKIVLSKSIVQLTTSGGTFGSTTATLLDINTNTKNIDNYVNTVSEQFEIAFSLKYMALFASFHKIGKDVKLHITQDNPLRMEYCLNEENVNSTEYLRLFLAPLVDDEDEM